MPIESFTDFINTYQPLTDRRQSRRRLRRILDHARVARLISINNATNQRRESRRVATQIVAGRSYLGDITNRTHVRRITYRTAQIWNLIDQAASRRQNRDPTAYIFSHIPQ